MRLYVDSKKAFKGFMETFEKNLELAKEALKSDIESNMSKKLLGLNPPQVYVTLKRETNNILIKIKSNMEFIVDNYGTGSLMSLDNPMLSKYKNSKLWNRARTSNNIVGRPKGEYTDLFGRTHTSSGSFEGVNLEYRTLKLGKGKKESKRFIMKPITPTNALHIALHYFYEDWFPKFYQKTIKDFDFSKYITYK